jgi:uncharacterized membrane protein YccF (DUF307 family)
VIDISTLITVLGIPANIGIMAFALWLIDRRLVRIETALSLRSRRDPFDHAEGLEMKL